MFVSIVLITGFALIWGYVSLGLDAIDTYNLRWINRDLATVYGSWVFYLADHGASWLSTNRPSYPIPINVAWFDAMPLYLLVAQLIPKGLVEGQQFFGVYFIICLALQGIFGYLAALRSLELVGVPDGITRHHVALLAGIFFVLVPYTMMRFQAHAALSSQWILAASIVATLWTIRSDRQTWLSVNGLVAFLAAGINLYLLLMILISNIFTIASQRRTIGAHEILYRIVLLSSVAMMGIWTFGYLSGPHATTNGYGYFSMNMLGPIDSNGWGGLWGLDVADPTGGQTFEGFTYLGLGTLLLIAAIPLCLSHECRVTLRSRPFPAMSIILMAIFFYAISLSNIVTLSGMVFQIPIPEPALTLLSAFRSSGRFFWMAGFWLILSAAAIMALQYGLRKTALIMAVLWVVQLIDVYPIAVSIRTSISQASMLEMREIDATQASALLVHPPYQCNPDATPGGARNYEFINTIAIKNNIPTNNFYVARLPMDQFYFHCNEEERLAQINSRAIYFLSQTLYAKHSEKFTSGFLCSLRSLEGEKTDSFWVCVPDH